jgi:hypothetical protein
MNRVMLMQKILLLMYRREGAKGNARLMEAGQACSQCAPAEAALRTFKLFTKRLNRLHSLKSCLQHIDDALKHQPHTHIPQPSTGFIYAEARPVIEFRKSIKIKFTAACFMQQFASNY